VAALKVHRGRKRNGERTPFHSQHIAHPGACGKTPVVAQNRWPKLKLSDIGDCHVSIEHSVVVAGGGPTGLMLAAELAVAGVDVVVAERRANQDLIGSRAGGLHSRTIELLDQRGIADRFLTSGQIAQVAGFSQIRLDISDFPSRHPYGLALWQNHIERILAGWVEELGVPVYRGREVTGVDQDGAGVDVQLSGGQRLRAAYLAGCDGGRSAVRKSAGIDFPGWDPTMSYLLAEVEMAFPSGSEPDWGVRHDAIGVHALSESTERGSVRVMVTEQHLIQGTEPTLGDLREALVAVYGTDYGIHSPAWISRATDATRQAASYRNRRVLLAGDAAHVHHPIGGQGLNTGLQDAVNLGWKLALVAAGSAPDTLLDSYHAERHPVAARVLQYTLAQMALLRNPTDDRTKALRDIMSEVLLMDEPRRRIAATMSGLDIHYDLGPGHPLLGRRMPDLDIVIGEGPRRVFTLLHDAPALLINFGEPDAFSMSGWADRVRLIDAKYVGKWELPVFGTVAAPDAVLVRPDGYVAWVGDGSDAGLTDALSRWFGPPRLAPG
jgi:2-polyprenyl-6-methoxyphenol hydroxylase-like FAD-dependent oxidoreductase